MVILKFGILIVLIASNTMDCTIYHSKGRWILRNNYESVIMTDVSIKSIPNQPTQLKFYKNMNLVNL